MNRVGVRELRRDLSAWLRRVGEGEAFEITNRGRPVALLAPLPRESDPIALPERRGRIVHRGHRTSFSLPTLRTARSTDELLGELREDKV